MIASVQKTPISVAKISVGYHTFLLAWCPSMQSSTQAFCHRWVYLKKRSN